MKQELDDLNLPFMAKSAGPPWLPAPVVEAREIAWWTQWVLALLGIMYIIAGILSFFTIHSSSSAFWAGYILVCGFVYYVLLYLLKTTFFDVLDQGRFKDASDKLIIWIIVGLFFLFLPSLMLILVYIRLSHVFHPSYQPYPVGPSQPGQTQPPPQQPASPPPVAPAPPPQPAAPQSPSQASTAQAAEQEKPKRVDMVKCKKCGVQYPSFMRTCPNCNEPR